MPFGIRAVSAVLSWVQVVNRGLPDRLRRDVDVLALVDADAVEDVEAGVLQRDQAAAKGGAGGHGLVEG
jgi:hypothetical protein